MQAIQKKYLQFLFDLVFICKYSQEMKKIVHSNICFLSLHIHTASKGYQSTFLTFKQSFHIPTNFKKVCDIFYFHTFWSNFHLMYLTFDHPVSLQCPKAVCRINAINACIVYICTSVFQFSNCRIFCFFTGYLQSGCKSLQKRSWWIIQICSSLDHFLEGQVIIFIYSFTYLFTTILLTRFNYKFQNYETLTFHEYLPLSCSLDPATNSENANL